MAVGDIYRFAIKGVFDGQAVYNTGHYRVTAEDAVTPWGATSMSAAIKTWWQAQVRPQLSVSYSFKSVDAVRVLPTLGLTVTSLNTLAQEGEVIGDALPSIVSVVLSFRTALGGRANRGRWYIAGIPESQTTLSRLTEAGLAIWQGHATGMTALLASGATNRAEFGILSKRSTVVAPNTFNKVIVGIANEVLGTMRSRMIGRGI